MPRMWNEVNTNSGDEIIRFKDKEIVSILSSEFFLIEFYIIYQICRIRRILFLVIFIYKITRNSILQIV